MLTIMSLDRQITNIDNSNCKIIFNKIDKNQLSKI